jgi:hypothetical protein
MSTKHSQTLSIVAAGLAALAVAGCGSGKQAGTTTPAAAQAPAATTPAATTTTPAETTPAAASPAPAGGKDPVAIAAATTDRQGGGVAFAMKGVVTTEGKPVPLSVRGTVDRKGQRGEYTSSTTFGTASLKVKQIIDKQLLYLNSPVFAGRLPGGKSWMKIDLAQVAKTPGLDLNALGASGPSQAPASGLDYLHGAGAAKELGTAKVGGVATTHYRVKVDLERAAKRSPDASAKTAIKRLIDSMKGHSTLPVDVWIDANHLVRRQRVDYTATVAGQTSKFVITTDYTAYGAKVSATPPADSATFDGLNALKKAAAAQKEAQDAAQTQG